MEGPTNVVNNKDKKGSLKTYFLLQLLAIFFKLFQLNFMIMNNSNVRFFFNFELNYIDF